MFIRVSFLVVLMLQKFMVVAQTEGFVFKYTGTIGKEQVVADVKIIDTSFSGDYYFVKTGETRKLDGKINQSSVYAKEETGEEETGIFSGTINADHSAISGTCMIENQKKSIPFQWKSIHAEGSATIGFLDKDYNYAWKKNKGGVELGCKASYSLCFLTGLPDAVKKRINDDLLEADVKLKADKEELKEAAIEFMDDDFDSYQEDFDTAYAKAGTKENERWMDESPAMYQWQKRQSYEVLFNGDYLVTLRQFNYEISGGTPASYIVTNVVYNLKTGNQVELNDVFKQGYRTQLNQLAQLQLMYKYKAGSMEQLSEKGFHQEKVFSVNENFFVQKDGIGFTFNPDEIASHATGEVTILIPWSSLQQLINPAGPAAWALKEK